MCLALLIGSRIRNFALSRFLRWHSRPYCPPRQMLHRPLFQNSCRNIELQIDPSMVRIQTDCQTRNGGYTRSGIRVAGISNEFGSLRRLSNGPSPFQNSCDDIELHTSSDEVKISAICEDGRGSTKCTSVLIHGVDNADFVVPAASCNESRSPRAMHSTAFTASEPPNPLPGPMR